MLTYCTRLPTLRGMGRHIPRTATELFAEATEARRAAGAEMENWRAHVAALEHAAPDDRAALEHQVRRSARIVQAQMDLAETKAREANRVQAQTQLSVVS